MDGLEKIPNLDSRKCLCYFCANKAAMHTDNHKQTRNSRNLIKQSKGTQKGKINRPTVIMNCTDVKQHTY